MIKIIGLQNITLHLGLSKIIRVFLIHFNELLMLLFFEFKKILNHFFFLQYLCFLFNNFIEDSLITQMFMSNLMIINWFAI